MIERQVIVTWEKPDKKTPPEGDIVVVTMSGKSGNVTYDHAFMLAEWYEGDGWVLPDVDLESYTIHAWCDLEPYKG